MRGCSKGWQFTGTGDPHPASSLAPRAREPGLPLARQALGAVVVRKLFESGGGHKAPPGFQIVIRTVAPAVPALLVVALRVRAEQNAARLFHPVVNLPNPGTLTYPCAPGRTPLQSARISHPTEPMPDTASQPAPATVPSGAEWRYDRSLPRALARILALDDFEEPARRYLPRPMFGYVSGGAETNASLRANRAQFDEIELSPRVLVDVSGRTAKTTLFGRGYDAPFGIAPMGGTSMAAYRGDVVLARAAAERNIPMIMSGASLTRLEDVRSAGSTAWFQAYLLGETDPITRLLERVARAGFDTLVLTVDVPVSANRENNVRSGFSRPLRPTARLAWESALRPRWLVGMLLRTLLVDGMPHFENMGVRIPLITRASRGDGERDRLAWTHLELMRRLWKGRLVLKGVLDPADARIARESGVGGVIVSNHGGRQLARAFAPLRAPPAGVVSSGPKAVSMDGRSRSGLR